MLKASPAPRAARTAATLPVFTAAWPVPPHTGSWLFQVLYLLNLSLTNEPAAGFFVNLYFPSWFGKETLNVNEIHQIPFSSYCHETEDRSLFFFPFQIWPFGQYMVRCRDGILTPVTFTTITEDLLAFSFLLSILPKQRSLSTKAILLLQAKSSL